MSVFIFIRHKRGKRVPPQEPDDMDYEQGKLTGSDVQLLERDGVGCYPNSFVNRLKNMPPDSYRLFVEEVSLKFSINRKFYPKKFSG